MVVIQGMGDTARYYSSKTGKKGELVYRPGVQRGTFRIIVYKEGYILDLKENIAAKVNEIKEINFQLKPDFNDVRSMPAVSSPSKWTITSSHVPREQMRIIQGNVIDDKGQLIAGAGVALVDMNNGRYLKSRTDKRGHYEFLMGLGGRTYRIIAHAQGCKPAWHDNVAVGLGETYEQNFKLSPGDDYETFWELSPDLNQGKPISDASALMDEGKYADSIIKAQKILIAMYALIGENNMKLGKFEDARNAYESALKYQANNPELLMNLGVVLTKLVRNEEAQEVFRRAAEANRARNSNLLGGSGVK
jgi:hypothetical protein